MLVEILLRPIANYVIIKSIEAACPFLHYTSNHICACRKIALDPASAARTTGKLPRIASDVDASPKTMRVYWHTIHWRRLLAAGVVLISLALFLPLVALSYLDRGIFSSNEIQEVGALSENEKIRLSGE